MANQCTRCGRAHPPENGGAGGLCAECAAADRVPEGVLLSVDIRFRCPACSKKIAVEARHGGVQADCPRCGLTLRIPRVPPPGQGDPPPASLLSESEMQVLLTVVPEGA